MKLLLTALLVAASAGVTTSADDKPLSGDLAKLQGKWKALVGTNKDQDLTWEFKGEKLVAKGKTGNGGEDYMTTSTVAIDESASPKRLDQSHFVVAIEGKGEIEQESTLLAIYKLKGDELIICSGSFDGERPMSFEDRDKGGEPIVFKRVRNGAASKE